MPRVAINRNRVFAVALVAASICMTSLRASAAGDAVPVKLEVTPIAPVKVEKRGNVWFADFGKDAYGQLQLKVPADMPPAKLTVRLGEKLDASGAIDRHPPGSVNFCELTPVTFPGRPAYEIIVPIIPSKPAHLKPGAVREPDSIHEVTPFRYAEIEGLSVPLDTSELRQLFVHAPFDDSASSFESSDATLNAVWDLCKHTMKATTAFGIYIDGERERVPYEADAYINMLSHYACDLDPRVAHVTLEYLLKHPTWPTEWSLHMPMMAAADYEATGDTALAQHNYDALKKKLLMNLARKDGLLRAGAIVDWPEGERDGYNNGQKFPGDRQLGPEYNTVVNAFYYHALQGMTSLAHAIGKEGDAREFEVKAKQVYASFNAKFFDAAQGLYIDGEGSSHASLHGNLFALDFGLVPAERQAKVADFVQSRGMACSVYGAQYLLETMFKSGKDDYALRLMTDRGERGWVHMMELGSTMTTEAWDAKFKPNLTWNHAWGSAPANIVSRFVLGVRPLEPGYAKLLVAPQPGKLAWVQGKVPTARGPVTVKVTNSDGFKLDVDIPAGTTARLAVPNIEGAQVRLDGKKVSAVADGLFLAVDNVTPGHHVLERRLP